MQFQYRTYRKMQLRNLLLAPLTVLAPLVMADVMESEPAPVMPQLTLLYSMRAELGERFSLGSVPTGQERIVIPIVGGTFTGPRLNGNLTTSVPSVHPG